jgi:hypothetical protein
MNDKQMIEKIKTTFTGPEHIDNAVQHYRNARKVMSLEDAYQSVLRFLNNDIEYFKYLIGDDIAKTGFKNSLWSSSITHILNDRWSTRITKWQDGYEIIIYRPDAQILTSKCGLDFEQARKMIEEWRVE